MLLSSTLIRVSAINAVDGFSTRHVNAMDVGAVRLPKSEDFRDSFIAVHKSAIAE